MPALTIALLLAFFVGPVIVNVAIADESIATALGYSPSPVNTPLPKGVDSTTGFRMERYRRAVPTVNPGTETVSTSRAIALHSTDKVIFIDVYPPRGLGHDPFDGTWQTNETHKHIEGSTWLPEVGRGHIEDEHVSYFRRNLQLLTNNNRQAPLLFYCTSDCWQSWNAARRALQWGYEIIFWYPDGTDGWQEENRELVLAEPVNFFGE